MPFTFFLYAIGICVASRLCTQYYIHVHNWDLLLHVRPKFHYVHYFLIYIDLKLALIFFKRTVLMPGISNRIFTFAKYYSQLKFLVAVVSPLVKLTGPWSMPLKTLRTIVLFVIPIKFY
jgi:hypothetical protein